MESGFFILCDEASISDFSCFTWAMVSRTRSTSLSIFFRSSLLWKNIILNYCKQITDFGNWTLLATIETKVPVAGAGTSESTLSVATSTRDHLHLPLNLLKPAIYLLLLSITPSPIAGNTIFSLAINLGLIFSTFFFLSFKYCPYRHILTLHYGEAWERYHLKRFSFILNNRISEMFQISVVCWNNSPDYKKFKSKQWSYLQLSSSLITSESLLTPVSISSLFWKGEVNPHCIMPWIITKEGRPGNECDIFFQGFFKKLIGIQTWRQGYKQEQTALRFSPAYSFRHIFSEAGYHMGTAFAIRAIVFFRFFSSSPFSMYRAMILWTKADVHRSAVCFAITSLSSISGWPITHPTLNPGQRFLKM